MLERYRDHAGIVVRIPGLIEFITALYVHQRAVIVCSSRGLGHVVQMLRCPFFAEASPTFGPFLVGLRGKSEWRVEAEVALKVDHRIANRRMFDVALG